VKLHFLQSLTAVIKHGSFPAAAPEVNLTASAVGMQIRQLEIYFGRPLFDRSGRAVRPTPLALEVAAAVESALGTLEQLRSRTEAAVTGHVRLGIIESAQVALLPQAMLALRKSVPGLEVHCARGVSQLLLQDLKAGRLDVAVLVRPETGGSSRLSWTPLLTESFVLVAPPQARGRNVRELLAAHEWIRLDRSATGGRIAAAFVEATLPGKREFLELPGTDAIVAMVSAGVGVSVVPELREDVRRTWPVREVGLGRRGPTRQIALVCRAGDAEDRRIQAVLRAFQASVAQGRNGSA
jgi:DNA-binding transcriptional LysR family regulator